MSVVTERGAVGLPDEGWTHWLSRVYVLCPVILAQGSETRAGIRARSLSP